MNRNDGFTLVELLVTLAVVAILATLAVPGFFDMIQNNRTTTQTNELVSALNIARSEAIRRGAPVTVRPAGASFAAGWCVHTGASCAGNDIIRQHPALQRLTVAGNTAAIVFDGRGIMSAPPGPITMTIHPDSCPSGAANRARQLQIINTGRVSVAQINCP